MTYLSLFLFASFIAGVFVGAYGSFSYVTLCARARKALKFRKGVYKVIRLKE